MSAELTSGAPASPVPFVVPLRQPTPDRAAVGGKAAHIGRVASAGLSAPAGFVVTTAAYRSFLTANRLAQVVHPDRVFGTGDAPGVEDLAAEVETRFGAATIPSAVSREVGSAYRSLGGGPVAVRSSASVEDTIDRSFAGLADTYLNVVDLAGLEAAIVGCWSSLFGRRALAYLRRPGHDPVELSMAVIVQVLIDADVSGVLFTADPVTGRRTEMLVEAAFGLGEGLVSGRVEPDRYRLDTDGRIVEVSIGSKATSIRPRPSGGTETVDAHRRMSDRALTDLQLATLADIGRRAEDLLGGPQDIEWAVAGVEAFVLQARPITSLFPVPDDLGPEPVHVLVSYGSTQGLTDPITPLGQDGIQLVNLGAARAFGLGKSEDDQLFRVAGERLWIDITRLFRSRVGRRAVRALLAALEPGAQASLRSLERDRRLAVGGGLPLSWLVRVVPHAVPMVVGLLRALVRPDQERRAFERTVERELARAEERFAGAHDLQGRLEVAERELIRIFEHLLTRFVPRYWAGAGAQMVLHRLATGVPNGTEHAFAATRGLPHNVTTAMGLELWRTAETIGGDPDARRQFLEASPQDLAERYLAETLPEPAQSAIAAFLARYGMRSVGEVDLGRPRWNEEPATVMQALQNYQQIDDRELHPDVQFSQSAAAAEDAIGYLTSALRETRGGWFKAKLARLAAERMRALTGLRELPKFLSVNVRGFTRSSLLAGGRQLTANGVLDRPDDVFLLHFDELKALARENGGEWKRLVADRRATLVREMGRRQIPRMLLSDGQAFYESTDPHGSPEEDGGQTLVGDPVSPGVVEGSVRVLSHPGSGALSPGQILVCRGADPGWTPLFLVAGGLVMETGGAMTHGAVVAREYGIPAVAGVRRATERLRDGQHIRVDGTRGRIEMLG